MSVVSPARRADATPVTTWPQVNLLPSEVTAGRRLQSIKKLLVLALAIVVLLAASGYAGSLWLARAAAAQLDEAQAENVTLQAEKATYAEVPQTLSAISQAESARQQAMAPEILWPSFLESLRAVTPTGVSYDVLTVNVGTLAQPWTGSGDPLASATSIGQVAFTARSTTIPDTAAWIDAINTVKGMDNPWFSSATLTERDGNVFYEVSATVDLLPSALAGRFEPEGQQ